MRRLLLVLALLILGGAALSAQQQGIDVGFARKGQISTGKDLVLKVIASAKTELRMACYNFTEPDIIAALVAAKKRGVDVQVLHDAVAASEKGDGTKAMQAAGIPIRLDKNFKIMHHKFIIVDRVTLETGSFNYSTNAQKENAENVIVIWNDPRVAGIYLAEWGLLWVQTPEATAAPAAGTKS